MLEFGIHAGFKEVIGRAAFRLGLVKRQIGVLDQLIGAGAIARPHGNAHRSADLDLLAADIHRRPHRLDDAVRHLGRQIAPFNGPEQQREFVPAQPRQQVGFPRRAPQAHGRLLDHLVAHGMAERVVDRLEMIKIDIEHCGLLAAIETGFHLGHLLEKFDAIGQVGQRVMARQMLDARLGLALLGNIFMGGHPAAILHRMVLHQNGASIQFVDILAIFAPGDHVTTPGDVVILGAPGGHALIEQMAQNVLELTAGFQQMDGQIVNARIGLVADHQPPARIHHAQANRDIVDRRIEPDVLPLQFQLALLLAFGAGDFVGDVLVGDHPAQFFRIDMGSFDDAAATDHFLRLVARATAIGQQFAGIMFIEGFGALAGVIAQPCREMHHVLKRHAAINGIPGEAVKIAIVLVPHDKAELWRPDTKAVGNAFQGCIEQQSVGHIPNVTGVI